MFGLLYRLFDGDYIGALIYSLSCVVPVYIITDKTLVKEERRNILVIYILAFFVVFFWAAFEQAGASLTCFAEEQTDRILPKFFDFNLSLTNKVVSVVLFTVFAVGLTYLIGKKFKNSFDLPTYLSVIIFAVTISFIFFSSGDEVNTSYFGSLNPIFIIILAPVMSSMWMMLESKNIHIASPTKQAIWGGLRACWRESVDDVDHNLVFGAECRRVEFVTNRIVDGQQVVASKICVIIDERVVFVFGDSQ